MLAYLRKPHLDLGTLTLRLALAGVLITHGVIKLAQKGGSNWTNELPEGTQMVVAWAELCGGIALGLGFLSRLAALGIIPIQVGAIALVSGPKDFIHSSFTAKEGFNFHRIGYEYNFCIIMVCLAVILLGSGKLSLDHCLGLWWRRKAAATAGVQPQPLEPVGRG